MLVLNNSYELGTIYLQVFVPWMLCSELAVYLLAFILSQQVILCLFEVFQFYARTSHPLKKSAAGKVGSLYLGYSYW